jgi:hypothetical protein
MPCWLADTRQWGSKKVLPGSGAQSQLREAISDPTSLRPSFSRSERSMLFSQEKNKTVHTTPNRKNFFFIIANNFKIEEY